MDGKTVYLLRHAKSSWDDPALSDRKRPLNERGQRNAPRMAKRFAERLPHPQIIISSPALRARTTAEIFASEPGMETCRLVINEDIYGASTKRLINIIREVDDSIDCIMLVGHNPDLTWLVNELVGADIDNLPTCSVVTINIASVSWKDTGKAHARLVDFDFPKKALE